MLSDEIRETQDNVGFLVNGPTDEFNKKLYRRIGEWVSRAQLLEQRIEELEEALKEIAIHKHNSYSTRTHADDMYNIGVVDGHRCAAGIAKLAIAHKEVAPNDR